MKFRKIENSDQVLVLLVVVWLVIFMDFCSISSKKTSFPLDKTATEASMLVSTIAVVGGLAWKNKY